MSDQMQVALDKLKAHRALVKEAESLFARMHTAGLNFPGSVRGRGSGPSTLLDLAAYYMVNQPNELQLTSCEFEPGEGDRLFVITVVNIGDQPVTAALTLHDQNGESVGVAMRFVILAPGDEEELTFVIPAGKPSCDSDTIYVKATTGLMEPYKLSAPRSEENVE